MNNNASAKAAFVAAAAAAAAAENPENVDDDQDRKPAAAAMASKKPTKTKTKKDLDLEKERALIKAILTTRTKRSRKQAANRNELQSVAIKESDYYDEMKPKMVNGILVGDHIWHDPLKLDAIDRWRYDFDNHWTPLIDWKNHYYHPTHPDFCQPEESNHEVLVSDMGRGFAQTVVPLMSKQYKNDPEQEKNRILQVNKLVMFRGFRYWQDPTTGTQYLVHDNDDARLAPFGMDDGIPKLGGAAVVPNRRAAITTTTTTTTIASAASSTTTATTTTTTTTSAPSTRRRSSPRRMRPVRFGDSSSRQLQQQQQQSSSTSHRNRQETSASQLALSAKALNDDDDTTATLPTTTTLKVGDRVYIPSQGLDAHFQSTRQWGIWGRICDTSKLTATMADNNVYHISLVESGYRVERAADTVFSYDDAKRIMNHPLGIFPDQPEPSHQLFDEDGPQHVLPERHDNTLSWSHVTDLLDRMEREEKELEEEHKREQEERLAQFAKQKADEERKATMLAKRAATIKAKQPVEPHEWKEMDFRKGTIVYSVFPDDGFYYWAKITQRRWDDEHGVWLYDLLYNDGDEAVDLKATDMYTMEETLETQRKEPNLGIATLPDGWASPFMSTEEKEKMLGLWKHVYAARRRKRGSKEDCLEYDWAQIVSRGKRNEQGKLVFKVRYADETTGFADCSLMRGLHEMVTFMKSNEIKDEETPPASWLNERKKSKHCPEKSLMTVVEKETLFNIGTRVYAEYIDKQFGPSGYYWGTIVELCEEGNGRKAYTVKFTDGDECEQVADNLHSLEEAETMRRNGSSIERPPKDDDGWNVKLPTAVDEGKARASTPPSKEASSVSKICGKRKAMCASAPKMDVKVDSPSPKLKESAQKKIAPEPNIKKTGIHGKKVDGKGGEVSGVHKEHGGHATPWKKAPPKPPSSVTAKPTAKPVSSKNVRDVIDLTASESPVQKKRQRHPSAVPPKQPETIDLIGKDSPEHPSEAASINRINGAAFRIPCKRRNSTSSPSVSKSGPFLSGSSSLRQQHPQLHQHASRRLDLNRGTGNCECCRERAQSKYPHASLVHLEHLGIISQTFRGCPQCLPRIGGALICGQCWEMYEHTL